MEPDASLRPDDAADRPEAGRREWTALSRLRDRVEAAAREVERLRAENAALARRVLELQDARDVPATSFSFGGDGEDVDALRARVQGFIDTIDGILQAGDPAGDGPAGDGAGGDGAADAVPRTPDDER